MLFFSVRTVVTAIIVAGLVSGCASTGWFQTPEERVEQRAQARLDALMRGDMEEAFSYVTPAYRKTTTWQRYGSKYAGVGNWREARVERVVCEPQRCEVKTSIRYQMIRPRLENTRSVEEVWIEVGGEWYIYGG